MYNTQEDIVDNFLQRIQSISDLIDDYTSLEVCLSLAEPTSRFLHPAWRNNKYSNLETKTI